MDWKGVGLAAALASGAIAHAQELPDLNYELVESFSRCAGLYDALGEIMDANGRPATAEQMRGFSNGAEVVAQFAAAAVLSRQTPQQALTTVASIKESELTRQRALRESGELDVELLEHCKSLNALQTTMIQTLREEGYLSGRQFGDPLP